MKNEAKQSLRRAMMTRRNQLLPPEREGAARAVLAFVDEILDLGEIEDVACYYPVRGEFETFELMQKLVEKEIQTALPVIDSAAQPLSFYPWKPGEPVEIAAYDIPVPRQQILGILPDVIVLPLLGFDQKGHRLGYGGGYYDRTLNALRQISKVVAVGIAYDFQQLDKLPNELHDEPLDYILTPSGVRKF